MSTVYRHPPLIRAYAGMLMLLSIDFGITVYVAATEGFRAGITIVAFALAVMIAGSLVLSARATALWVRIEEDRVEASTFLGVHTVLPFSKLEAVEDFDVATYARANRRVRLVGSGDTGYILFSDGIEDFEELLAAVRRAAPHAELRGQPPWWRRFLLTG